VLRLRPIMMTMLVATLGLLPAALSHAIGSDTQRPFAIVIIGGVVSSTLLTMLFVGTAFLSRAFSIYYSRFQGTHRRHCSQKRYRPIPAPLGNGV